MQTAPIIFASNNKPFSLLIKLGTLSNWCHCAIVDGDYVIDATLATGVRRILRSEWESHYNEVYEAELPISHLDRKLRWARKQVGKKYDPLAILSFILRRNVQVDDRWMCSELVATYLGIKHKPWNISPEFIYRVYRVLKGYII